MTGVIATIPRYQFSNSLGVPLVNGTVTVYLAGSTTPTNTWQDQAQTTLNTNPVTLDSRGECVLWLDPTISYKFLLKDSGGSTQWTTDNISGAGSAANTLRTDLAASSGASLISWIRAVAGAVVYTLGEWLGWQKPSVFEFMTIAQRIDVLAGTAAVDVTTAVQTAITNNGTLDWPRGIYLISESLTVTNKSALEWKGTPNFTFILNKASAGKPTFVFTDTQHAVIDGVSPIGHSSYVNDGFRFTTAGGQTCAFIHMKNVKMQPNGNGIELRKVNTMSFDECSYWQSGGNGSGASASAGARAHAFFVDGTIAGNYANEIAINGGNLLDIDHTAVNHAAIKMKAGAGGSLQNITIDNVEMEGIGNIAVDIDTAYNITITKCFTENARINLTSCRYSEVADCYSLKDLYFVGCINSFIRNMTVETGGFNVDVTSSNCGGVNANLGTLTDASTTSTYLNCTAAGGVLQADKLGVAGLKERNRSVAMGEWVTPTYSAANFAAATGNWTVDVGDVVVYRYTMIGKTMHLDLYLDSTSVSATPAYLTVAIPGGFTAANRVIVPIIVNDNSGATKQIGAAYAANTATVINLYSSANFGAWQTSANLTSIYASIILEVQ